MNAENRRTGVICIGLMAAFMATTGCEIQLDPDPPAPNNTATLSDGDRVQPTGDAVIVRFRNFTVNDAVNVEFYATNRPLLSVPGDLFLEENLVTESIGVAGTGIVQPQTEDTIAFPCGANLTLGTAGGSFSDNESGEPRGLGIPRWAQEGPLALCGSVVTFEFSGNGTDFVTILTIGN
jgi:hypothetical protein